MEIIALVTLGVQAATLLATLAMIAIMLNAM